MLFVRLISLVFAFTLFSTAALADVQDRAFLDPPYKEHRHPKPSEGGRDGEAVRARQSDTEAMLARQTAVKAQAARGTCSIFSATAILESLLVTHYNFPISLDLSEEWLEYLIMRERASEGSFSTLNFRKLAEFGSPTEALYPYIGETWSSVDSSPLARERCGHLTAEEWTLTACLLGHRDPAYLVASDRELLDPRSRLYDPDFHKARVAAFGLRAQAIELDPEHSLYVSSEDEIKAQLRKGVPVTLDIDFFYGAWNHRKANELGINRDLNNWSLGIVGYPERNSADHANSRREPAGHSVVIVGYDDDYEVVTESLMKDGTTKKFRYKGVYFFKNSWGTESFGVNFSFKGKNYPGYGVITQKYAHEYGTFARMPLKLKPAR